MVNWLAAHLVLALLAWVIANVLTARVADEKRGMR